MILFQNIGYTHAEWIFRDRDGQWAAQGQLQWPWGDDYEEPQPIRICYPSVMLKNRSVHFLGVSDIIEPNSAWRAFKKELTGKDWDYDFRRLFYTWSPDITQGTFQPWVEIASRESTGGWISPRDLYLEDDGTVHRLWTERALDIRLRDQFFPDEKQTHSMNYAQLQNGRVVSKRVLALATEDGPQEIPRAGRFHITPDHRLMVVYYVQGTNASEETVSENRIMELLPDGTSPAGGYFAPDKNPQLSNGPDGESLPLRLGRETARFIDQQKKGEPFLAYLSFYSVHSPIQTTRPLWSKYRQKATAGDTTDQCFIFDRRMPVRQVQDCPIYAGMIEIVVVPRSRFSGRGSAIAGQAVCVSQPLKYR